MVSCTLKPDRLVGWFRCGSILCSSFLIHLTTTDCGFLKLGHLNSRANNPRNDLLSLNAEFRYRTVSNCVSCANERMEITWDALWINSGRSAPFSVTVAVMVQAKSTANINRQKQRTSRQMRQVVEYPTHHIRGPRNYILRTCSHF